MASKEETAQLKKLASQMEGSSPLPATLSPCSPASLSLSLSLCNLSASVSPPPPLGVVAAGIEKKMINKSKVMAELDAEIDADTLKLRELRYKMVDAGIYTSWCVARAR